jgi:hypothetical protein
MVVTGVFHYVWIHLASPILSNRYFCFANNRLLSKNTGFVPSNNVTDSWNNRSETDHFLWLPKRPDRPISSARYLQRKSIPQ